MFKDKFIEALKGSKDKDLEDKVISGALDKIQRQKRLSSDEFLKVYDTLWKEGPAVKYQNPDAWRNFGEKSHTP